MGASVSAFLWYFFQMSAMIRKIASEIRIISAGEVKAQLASPGAVWSNCLISLLNHL